jgi:hypothetical protein
MSVHTCTNMCTHIQCRHAIHTHTHTYMFVQTHVLHTHGHKNAYTSGTELNTHQLKCMHKSVNTRVQTCAHAYMQTRIYTNTHTHDHPRQRLYVYLQRGLVFSRGFPRLRAPPSSRGGRRVPGRVATLPDHQLELDHSIDGAACSRTAHEKMSASSLLMRVRHDRVHGEILL